MKSYDKNISKLKIIGRHYRADILKKLVKKIQPDQLVAVRDKEKEVVLGKGTFGIFKLKQFIASGTKLFCGSKRIC